MVKIGQVKSVSCSESDYTAPWTVEPAWFFCPWDSSAKNTGVGCHAPSPGDRPNPGNEPGPPAL